jgi:predicted RNA methylase
MMNESAPARGPNRYDRLVRRKPGGGPGSASPLENPARLQRQFDIIFSSNRDAFQGARALDLMSGSGFWSLAALDAGASHVVAVEPAIGQIEFAKKAFSEYGVAAQSYRFDNSDVTAALRSFEPGAFDVVLCHGYFEQTDPRPFFSQLTRLRVKRVVLDTRISIGKGPIVRLKQKSPDEAKAKAAARYSPVLSIPNHELITFFCDYFKFNCRLILGKTVALSNWTGLSDYEQDHRHAYLLERAATD